MALDATQDSCLTPLHATCCRRRRHSEHKGWDVERLGASEVYSAVTASVSLAVTQHLTNPPQHPPCQKQQGAVMPENGLSEQHSQMARCPQQWRRNTQWVYSVGLTFVAARTNKRHCLLVLNPGTSTPQWIRQSRMMCVMCVGAA
jgi:hypothetical protein